MAYEADTTCQSFLIRIRGLTHEISLNTCHTLKQVCLIQLSRRLITMKERARDLHYVKRSNSVQLSLDSNEEQNGGTDTVTLPSCTTHLNSKLLHGVLSCLTASIS